MRKYDKEEIYDSEVASLMNKIIETCKRENLPMVAQFYLKQDTQNSEVENKAMYCTTVIMPSKSELNEEPHEHLSYVANAMYHGKSEAPSMLAITITES